MADTQADRLAKAIDEASEGGAGVGHRLCDARQGGGHAVSPGMLLPTPGPGCSSPRRAYAQAAADTAKAWTAYNEVLKSPRG